MGAVVLEMVLALAAVFCAIAILRTLESLQRHRGLRDGVDPPERPLQFWRRAIIHAGALCASAALLKRMDVNAVASVSILMGQVATVLAVAGIYRAQLRRLNPGAARTVVWTCAVVVAAVSVASVSPLRDLTDFVLSGAKGHGAGGLLALPFAVLLVPVMAAFTAIFQLGASLLIIAGILAIYLQIAKQRPLAVPMSPPVVDSTVYPFRPAVQLTSQPGSPRP